MSDAFTFVAQVAAAGNLKLEVSFKSRSASSTDSTDQRDTWACRLLAPNSGRVLGEWDTFEDRNTMFETAARALAATAAQQILTWNNQTEIGEREAAQKVLEDKAKAEAAEAEAKKTPKKASKRRTAARPK